MSMLVEFCGIVEIQFFHIPGIPCLSDKEMYTQHRLHQQHEPDLTSDK